MHLVLGVALAFGGRLANPAEPVNVDWQPNRRHLGLEDVVDAGILVFELDLGAAFEHLFAQPAEQRAGQDGHREPQDELDAQQPRRARIAGLHSVIVTLVT